MKYFSTYICIFWLAFLPKAYAELPTPQCNIAKFKEFQLQYCFYAGKGPLIVLEPGQGESLGSWPREFINKLNQFSQVLVYNRIGYGKSYYYSKRINTPITAKTVSYQLHELLTQLNFKVPIILVGHSIGGIYSQYFVRNYPGIASGLVLIDSASPNEPQKNSPFVSKILPPKGTTAYFESIGYNTSMDQVNHSPDFPTILLLVISATNHDSPAKIENTWQQLQTQLASESTLGKKVIAEGSGHYVFIDDPNLVVNSIHEMIRKLPLK